MTAVKQTIGVIGSLGDLGSQLVRRAKKYGFLVREFDIADRHTNTEELSDCEIIHVCAPLENFIVPPVRGLIILHDSVMDTSRRFNNRSASGCRQRPAKRRGGSQPFATIRI